jgi:predicted nucleotidyltransferase
MVDMIALVAEKGAEVRELCRRFAVRRLELFGSAAEGTFASDRSDLDFLVEFEAATPREHKERYFGLLFSLEGLFGRQIDLLEPSAVKNPYLWRAIQSSRELVYAA